MRGRPVLRGALVGLAAIPTLAALWLAAAPGDTMQRPIALAPSSLAPVREALDDAMRERGITPPDWAFSGSQVIVAQVADGAPADVVLTADRVTFDAALLAGADQPRELAFASNHLVLAVATGNPGAVHDLSDLSEADLLIGLCAQAVPCGRLAAAALARFDVDAEVDTEESSARALTTKLVAGELDAGLVYRSDAEAAGLATITVDGLDELTNTYWGTANDGGLEVLDFLASDIAQAILRRAGFGP